MKLKVWAEATLFILASICGLFVFTDGLLTSALGLIGATVFAIPLAKYGRLVNKENERSK